MTIAFLLLGLLTLTLGAELLIRGASALAALLRVSPLVVGLTIVAYGTSMPEFVVSLQAAIRGQSDIALGNVVGSNTFNVLFILGLSALIVPLVVSQSLVRFDVPLMIAISFVVLVMGLDGRIGRIDGAVLFAGLVAYTVWAIRSSRSEPPAVEEQYDREFAVPPRPGTAGSIAWPIGRVLLGLVLLVAGSRWFSDAAIAIARDLGVAELVIGLTIVAVGTSLPEVFTSVLAALRNERDIAVGNIVGSNLFNLLGVLGVAAIVGPEGVGVAPAAVRLDLPVMIVTAVACLPIFLTGHVIARWEGGLFFAYYVAYTTWLVLRATGSESATTLAVLVLGFAAPLTLVTLVIGVVRTLRKPPAGEVP